MKRLLPIAILIMQCSLAHAAVQGSRSYDGVNDEMDAGNTLNTGTGSRTVCGWFKMTEDASADAMVGKKNDITAATLGYMLSQDTSDVVTFSVGDGTDSLVSTSTTDPDGLWKFICGSWESTGETTKIYVNGIQEDSDTGSGLIDTISNSVNFTVGQDGANGNDAAMIAAWIMTSPNAWRDDQISNSQVYPETRQAASMGLFPSWTGASPEKDIGSNGVDGTIAGAATSTDGPPTCAGGMGMAY